MIARITWWSVLVVVAACACLAQLDRISRFSPHLAGSVPESFKGFAAQRLTERAILDEDGEAALAEATILLAARPLPAEHLRLYSQASAMAGQDAQTLAALQAAAARGWRDPLAQIAAARAALAQSEYDAAAARIAALRATGLMPEVAMALAVDLGASPEGRAAMARQLAEDSHWRGHFIAEISSHLEPDRFVGLVESAREQGVDLPCDRLALIAQRYTRAGLTEQLARFWPGDCE